MSEDESFIVKPSDVGEMIRTGDKDALVSLYERPLSVIAASVAGWLASGPKEWILATGRIVQGALKVRFIEQLGAEIKKFHEKGKIAEDWGDKPKGYQTWSELLRVIDEETPDEDKLEALKAMFFAVNRISASDGERILAYQLFQIAKRLNSNDLLVMKIACETDGQQVAVNQRGGWYGLISDRLGHSVEGLVYLAEKTLLEHQLLSGVGDLGQPPRPKVTLLGRRFCENIKQYQLDKKP